MRSLNYTHSPVICIIVSYAEYSGQYNNEDKKQHGGLHCAFKMAASIHYNIINIYRHGQVICIIVSYAEYCVQYNIEDTNQNGGLHAAQFYFQHTKNPLVLVSEVIQKVAATVYVLQMYTNTSSHRNTESYRRHDRRTSGRTRLIQNRRRLNYSLNYSFSWQISHPHSWMKIITNPPNT